MEYTVRSSLSVMCKQIQTKTIVWTLKHEENAAPIWICSTHSLVAALKEANQDNVSLRRRKRTHCCSLVGVNFLFVVSCCVVRVGGIGHNSTTR